jgi:ferrous iron transport protein B
MKARIEEGYQGQVSAMAAGFGTAVDKIEENKIFAELAKMDSKFSVVVKEKGLEEDSKEYADLEKEKESAFERLKEIYPEKADLYTQYRDLTSGKNEQMIEIENAMAAEQIEKSYAGRLGHAIAPFFKPLGFDWRSSIALLSGFAAKEVVVATFGTLYSMGETDPKEAGSLREGIQKDPAWSPLKAFTFMMFCLLYMPCFVATAVFHREAGSWKWTGFMVLYTTVLAWVVSFIVYQGGMLLGLS